MNSRQRRKARRQVAIYYRKLPWRMFNDAKFFIARCAVGAHYLRMFPEQKTKFVYRKL